MQLNQVSTTSASASSATQLQNTPVLGEHDFLKLLITQLQNQDPMNPLDSTQLASQLAQFSSVQELAALNQNVQSSMNANYILTQSINNTMAATLIGKKVKANTSNLNFDGKNPLSIGFNLSSAASNVTIKIYDSNGNLVRTINAGSQAAGDSRVGWDGKGDDGRNLQAGKYTFTVSAADPSGKPVQANQYFTGTVEGVKFSSNGAFLIVDGNEISFSDVEEVSGS
ncbi:MAG: flagellar hook assembly protein FlgD [Candidatus Kryptoniota bacterium]